MINRPGVQALAANTEPITNTVPNAYAALAMPVVSWSDCRLRCRSFARIGVSGASAVLSAREGINAKTTNATALT